MNTNSPEYAHPIELIVDIVQSENISIDMKLAALEVLNPYLVSNE